jgi:opacity protein-like surface antigen
MKITKVSLLCGVLLASFSVGALAQNEWGNNADQGPYLELQYGRSQLRDHSFNIPGGRITTGSEHGDVGLLSFGYEFGNWGFGSLRAEAELGYRENGVKSQAFTPAGLTGKLGLNNPFGHTQAWSVMFNILNDFRPGTGFDPYVGVGVGYARVDFHHYGANPLNVAGATTGTTFIDDANGQPAYQGIVGFRSQLTDTLAFDLNWRYFATRNLHLRDTAGDRISSTYKTSQILVGLVWTY